MDSERSQIQTVHFGMEYIHRMEMFLPSRRMSIEQPAELISQFPWIPPSVMAVDFSIIDPRTGTLGISGLAYARREHRRGTILYLSRLLLLASSFELY